MADSTGKIRFIQEQLDEVPPFVHRVGNPIKELEGRITQEMQTVWKPVIHLTASVAMAVDLEVCINGGRPWVAYPKFDDLVLIPSGMGTAWNQWNQQPADPMVELGSKIETLDPAGLTNLKDLREGYPWITPGHREYPWDQFASRSPRPKLRAVGGVGVRWQSLIVSPKRLDWMKPAEVGDDPRFGWWKRLREVDCSWVSSRGESERFLYYDGPTTRPGIGRVVVANERLSLVGMFPRPVAYIDVGQKGVVIRWSNDWTSQYLVDTSGVPGPASDAEKQLQSELLKRGLSVSEAGGLLDCWRQAFFKTPGRRFLTLMSAADYDEACPIKIRPLPTERVRVGIIWTELGR